MSVFTFEMKIGNDRFCISGDNAWTLLPVNPGKYISGECDNMVLVSDCNDGPEDFYPLSNGAYKFVCEYDGKYNTMVPVLKDSVALVSIKYDNFGHYGCMGIQIVNRNSDHFSIPIVLPTVSHLFYQEYIGKENIVLAVLSKGLGNKGESRLVRLEHYKFSSEGTLLVKTIPNLDFMPLDDQFIYYDEARMSVYFIEKNAKNIGRISLATAEKDTVYSIEDNQVGYKKIYDMTFLAPGVFVVAHVFQEGRKAYIDLFSGLSLKVPILDDYSIYIDHRWLVQKHNYKSLHVQDTFRDVGFYVERRYTDQSDINNFAYHPKTNRFFISRTNGDCTFKQLSDSVMCPIFKGFVSTKSGSDLVFEHEWRYKTDRPSAAPAASSSLPAPPAAPAAPAPAPAAPAAATLPGRTLAPEQSTVYFDGTWGNMVISDKTPLELFPNGEEGVRVGRRGGGMVIKTKTPVEFYNALRAVKAYKRMKKKVKVGADCLDLLNRLNSFDALQTVLYVKKKQDKDVKKLVPKSIVEMINMYINKNQ